jgi:hypothetical protein
VKQTIWVYYSVNQAADLIMKLSYLLVCIVLLLIQNGRAQNNTAVVLAQQAETCQDTEFECYLYATACQSVPTEKYMNLNCQYTCGNCLDSNDKFAFPKKYSMFFNSPQYRYYSNNYYSGYNGFCCGCYGKFKISFSN